MSVVSKLATSLGRRDEVPNQELAKDLLRSHNRKAIKELVENLSNSDKNIQGDCIKVLYEIGEQEPSLIAEYAEDFGKLLWSKNNRLVWGAMTALDTIASASPEQVFALLPSIRAAAETESVIARDHAVGILVKLAQNKRFAGVCLPDLMQQLRSCPDNQFPMYAEMAFPVISQENKQGFLRVFKSRQGRLPKDSQKKRIGRLLRKLSP